MTSINDLEKEISAIKARNKKVEIDKAWETSLTRKIILIIFTYIAIGLYLQTVQIDRPWLNAIVPTLGFFLSTLTLPYLKRVWKRYFYK
ncbi:hypothetical protein COY88_00010 [Candidatus Roizmanbacteria bacterium CG_4_10_14_0_8_um_filter_35_28]|uniref:2TM domain-containing protein n=1 Tax=Candidatus Roizmanbacteria bacterium CG_4_10_14_0_8_um_filter_35_28 TaxID=1974827 RepID=A0A2M7QGP2_9BACT|nr:MAG: hypothetical protein COY88_00010 [Candidatus Roizmanbacteria bacterium CG_4_10_14_0_8_um_filter_35_28]